MTRAATVEITGTATADAGGTATVTLQAPLVGPRGLEIVSMALSVAPSPPIPAATVYRGVVGPQAVLASKRTGDRGQFIGTSDVLYMGQTLVVVWTNAAAGASCTVILRGYAR